MLESGTEQSTQSKLRACCAYLIRINREVEGSSS